MMEWVQTSYCSWQSDTGLKIVKQYKPCKGGIVYTLFDGKEMMYCRSLEKAMEEADGKSLRA